jgi:hypothetical protein
MLRDYTGFGRRLTMGDCAKGYISRGLVDIQISSCAAEERVFDVRRSCLIDGLKYLYFAHLVSYDQGAFHDASCRSSQRNPVNARVFGDNLHSDNALPSHFNALNHLKFMYLVCSTFPFVVGFM